MRSRREVEGDMSNIRRGREVRCAARMGRSFAAGRAAALNEAGDGGLDGRSVELAAGSLRNGAVSRRPPRVNALLDGGEKSGRRTSPQERLWGFYGVVYVQAHDKEVLAIKDRLACEPFGGVVVVKEMVCFPLGSSGRVPVGISQNGRAGRNASSTMVRRREG